MKNRFTRKSRIGRRRVRRELRQEVFERDNFTCQYCGDTQPPKKLTIDHLIPLALGGLDEMTNYVTCCRACNESKANAPLAEFAARINIAVENIPVYGDPIIDNKELPIELRLVRKRVFDRLRAGDIKVTGPSAQKKIEKMFRREYWETQEGKELETEFPNLPGHVRIMIPEIQAVAKNAREYLLLVELAKSANTRNLIGAVLTSDCDVEARLNSVESTTKDLALKKRIHQAIARFERETRRRGI